MTKKGFVMALLLVAIPCVSFGAIIYSESLTDISSGLGSGVYTLTIGDRGGDGIATTYDARLSVDTNVVAGDSIAWFAIKFDEGVAGVITASGITASDGSSWEVGYGSVDVLNYNDFPSNTWTGGYASPITGGFALDGGVYSWTFDFDLSAALNERPSLQVGFSAPHGYPRLSQSIPEPGTLMILGAGLIGLASLGRKKFRK